MLINILTNENEAAAKGSRQSRSMLRFNIRWYWSQWRCLAERRRLVAVLDAECKGVVAHISRVQLLFLHAVSVRYVG